MNKLSFLSKELDRRDISSKQKRIKIAEIYLRAFMNLIPAGGTFEKFIFGLADAERSQAIDDAIDILFENTQELRLRTLSFSNDLEKVTAELETLIEDKNLVIEKIINQFYQANYLSSELKNQLQNLEFNLISLNQKVDKISGIATKISEQIDSARRLVKAYDEVMYLKEYEINTLLDWPILQDIESGEESEVYIDEAKLLEIDQILTNSQIRRILLKGAGGRGKTVLNRLVAYRKNKINWDIFFIDVRELALSDIKELTLYLEDILKNKTKHSLFIFENAHLSDAITEAFVSRSDYFVKNYQHCHFIFASRDFARDEDINPFKNWKQNKWFSLIKPDEELIEIIIKRYIEANKIQYELTYQDREWIKYTLMYQTDSTQNTEGGDLRLLRLYLTSWDYKSCKLYELKEQNILARLKKFYVIDELSRDAGLIELLGKVVSIFQFDVPFYGKREYEPHTITLVEYLQRLNDRGIIKNIGQYYYKTTHSLDAYYLCKCLADFNKEAHEEFTAYKIIDYLKELPSVPRDRTGENIFSLFKGVLRRNRTGFDNITVFKIIYEEAKDLLLNTISINYRIGIITYLIQFINRTYDREATLHFWTQLKTITDHQFWIEKIDRSDDLSVALLTMNLGKISQDEGTLFFETYIKNYFKRLYLETNLILFEHFTRYLFLDRIDNIIDELNLENFKDKVLDCSSLITVNLIIDRFTKKDREGRWREKGWKFLKILFENIDKNDFNNFKVFLLKQNSYETIQRLRETLNGICPSLRMKIDKDKEIAAHFQNLRYAKIRKSPSGTVTITRRMAKDILHLKSRKEFGKFLSANFDDFELRFNSFNTISRLIDKIYKMTHNDGRYQELGANVINKIVYQLSDEVIKDACGDLRFLNMIEEIDKKLFDYISKKCRDIY